MDRLKVRADEERDRKRRRGGRGECVREKTMTNILGPLDVQDKVVVALAVHHANRLLRVLLAQVAAFPKRVRGYRRVS